MELDDLRQQWRQVPEQKPAVVELSALVRRPSTNLIGQMRRNTWGEIATASLTVAAALNFLLFQRRPVSVVYTGLLLVLVALMIGYYVLQIRLLRRMAETDGSVRGHLRGLCVSLRQLLRFNYKLTLWTGPVTWLVLMGYYVAHELTRADGARLPRLGLVLGLGLAVGVVAQLGLLRLTNWWSQYRYGQHLDRLESQLRELDEPAG